MDSQVSIVDGKHTKIVIIGVGSVGATAAYALIMSRLAAELVLIDVDKHKAEGEAMDLSHAASFYQVKVRVGGYEDCAAAAVVILTAGVKQKPGQSRMELLQINNALFKHMIPEIVKYAPNTILMVATNPVDVLTHSALQLSGFPPQRVIGTGTVLDTARFRYELGQLLKVNPRNIHATIIGEHGDTQLLVSSLVTISGMRLPDYCKQAGIEYDEAAVAECCNRTKRAAYDIIQRKGATNYGIASVLVTIVEAILKNSDALLPVSRVGNYAGVEDVALGAVCKLNRQGAHRDAPLLLSEPEQEALRKSAMSVKEAILTL
ncbi:lactate dehydrogenase [Thozetella sp. PMI_491]|nr:lactate dehydrogenase [Thozetella sp. PMI_491]